MSFPRIEHIECSDEALGAVAALTRRERDIAWRMAAGMRDRDIALATGTAPRTVTTQARTVLAKCGVTSRAELAARVARHLAAAAREGR